MTKKGLDPNNTNDIEKIDIEDYKHFINNVVNENNEDMKEYQTTVQRLAVTCYNTFQFVFDNKAWDPNVTDPQNDMSYCYVAAVSVYKTCYKHSSDTITNNNTIMPESENTLGTSTERNKQQRTSPFVKTPQQLIFLFQPSQRPASTLFTSQQEDEDYFDSEASLSSEGSIFNQIEEIDDEEEDSSDVDVKHDPVVCSYKDMYACDGESGAKGALKNCSKKGCKNCYHLDCIEMHLEATEGIDDDNWDRYNTLCLHCFQEKFELRTQHRIGNLHSEFDGNKEYVSKEKNGAELFVQNVSTKRFQIDKHRLYTDVSNKDWKVQDYFNKSLLQNYDYQVKQKTKSTNTVERCSLKPSKEDIDETEKLFANNDEVAVSHLKYCGTRIVHEIVKEVWFG